jgi:hypothetical protein
VNHLLARFVVWIVAGLTFAGSAGAAPPGDWLLDPSLAKARVSRLDDEVVLENGLVRRTIRIAPNAATIGLDNLMTGASVLRAVEPEAQLTLDGHTYAVGGLYGQRDRAYLLPEWIKGLTNDPGAFQFVEAKTTPVATPFAWKRTRHSADLPWPPAGAAVDLVFRGPDEATRGLSVTVHHEIYDGVPVLGKWLVVSNGTDHVVTLDRFTSERLAVVEAEAAVDDRPGVSWRTPALDVLSDYMFHGMDVVTGNQVASWQADPAFTTQVSYAYKTPCLLVVQPPIGPAARLEPGQSFTTFRSYVVVHDSTERERQGLTLRRVTKTLAPWTTENPLMMHVRNADTKSFRLAVDQCAEVGFEMIIYTFGSGLEMENQSPDYLAKIRADVDYAHAKGIQVGAYSLFSSRRIDDANDVVNPATGKPGGAIFGNAPCFGSAWGQKYFRSLTNFIARTGLDLLEHDGPYPGDLCASTHHPGHRGEADSQWVNWRMTADLYAWCREQGVYVNQPDYYFLAGGSKTGMGYREDNWSLPRAQQLIHGRQNIYDGTWTKPQTAGWMFVPLTEYHGGGAAATLEPLSEHLSDYEDHLANNLGAGVQACWRGPRLYDTEATRDLVKRWVAWFKAHRDILESDIIHCRRADGRDIDYLLHVNPSLKERGFAMIHNPLDEPVERTVTLPLYYTGLTDSVRIREQDGELRSYRLDRQQRASVSVKIPANGRTWLVVEAPVLKFEGAYHGQHPVGIASRLNGRPSSLPVSDPAGTRAPWVEQDVRVAPFNDLETSRTPIAAHAEELGGGFSIGTYGGNGALMDTVNAHRAVADHHDWSASTTGGNSAASAAGEAGQVLGDGPLAQLAFSAAPFTDQKSWLASVRGRALMLELLRRRVFLNPMRTKLYLSLAHDDSVTREFGGRVVEALVATSPLRKP